MEPIVTPQEMAAIDAAAPEPVGELIERAGAAVARHAVELLGGCYGRRVVVVAGRGNNGNDGRAAAVRLARRGARVAVVDAADAPAALPPAHLVIDAAYGTGLQRDYVAPDPAGAPVLAVDIPSGVDGQTGVLHGEPPVAVRTVTFAALKPGLVLWPGAGQCGEVVVADIGLDTSRARAHRVDSADIASWVRLREPTGHKWQRACWVVGGSPGMAGAPRLAAAAAARAGAGYVRLSSPGVGSPDGPVEVVGHALAAEDWGQEVARSADRFGAVVLGPGLGRLPATSTEVARLLGAVERPVVVDGDGLAAVAGHAEQVLGSRRAPTVLTPHDAEFGLLAGRRPGPDRFTDARELARRTGAVVLLKGPCTVVAAPDGEVLVATAGDARLATAGTGDVLAGVIGAFLAAGMPPLRAAAAAAWVHGTAAARGSRTALVAGDLLSLIPEVLDHATDLG